MTLLLLIPAMMIESLVTERQERRDAVAGEISQNWAAKQILIGPFLTVPVKTQSLIDQKNVIEGIQYAHFLPEKLNINGVVDPEMRNRGIYDIVVYNTKLDISATFNTPQFDEFNVLPENIVWKDAFVSFGITDMKGVKDSITVHWNNEIVAANPGVVTHDVVSSGISIPVSLTGATQNYTFQTKLDLNGSFGLFFSPIGKETALHLSSTWQNPSFTGDYLPTQREVNQNGFSSDWRVLHMSRDFPQKWVGARYEVDKSLFGVSLLLSVDQYQQTMRTVKYAIMFISLTFLTFFVIEILSGKPIHPIQYLLTGLALLVFYTLLLSLSEYVSFGLAYFIASAAVITLITLYSMSFLSERLRSAIVALVLAILYGYLYIVLQLQDYALLMGSLILFMALALTMYLTRKIDWFSILKYRKANEQG